MNIETIRKLSLIYAQGRVPPKPRFKSIEERLLETTPVEDHSHTYSEYVAYIRSKEWKQFCSKILAERGRKCQSCADTTRNMQVHHIHYRNLMAELPGDVKVLCDRCHRRFHTATKRKVREHLKPKDCWQAVISRMS